MTPATWLERQGPWRFDVPSAIIGALAAGLVALLIYSRRQQIKALANRIWAPIAAGQRRARASQEDKYLNALKTRLRGELLFAPKHPELILQAPHYAAPPPLPARLPDASHLPTPFSVSHARLLDGHNRIIVIGPLGAGKTTALAMRVWETAPQAAGEATLRLPVWIDLLQVRHLSTTTSKTLLERFVALAVLFMPDILPQWLLGRLRKMPSLILVDNWEQLSEHERRDVAAFLGGVADELPNSVWLVTSGLEGYGPLVEAGFVPVEIIPAGGKIQSAALCAGWASLLGKPAPELPEEISSGLEYCARAGASLMEMHLRSIVYLQTGQLPKRPVDVIDYYLETRIPLLDLGEGQEEVADQARLAALSTLAEIARAHRLERKVFTRQEIADLVTQTLPPESERPPKLEAAVRKLVTESGLLRREGQHWLPTHYLWESFFTAWLLAQNDTDTDLLEAHLHDPNWALILEFYVGLGDATALAQTLLRQAAKEDNIALLLRVARWATVAPEEAPWRKLALKALAQTFARPDIDPEARLDIGWALAVNAGDVARAFFLQMLRNPSQEIRCAALRGLGWSGTPREMTVLAGALGDSEFEVREAAVLALRDMGTPGAMRNLSDAFSKVDERTLLVVASALASNPLGYPTLTSATRDPDLLLRRAAAYALGTIDEPWAIDLLTQMMREDGEWLVRSAAESALAQLEHKDLDEQTVLPQPKVDAIEWLVEWAARQGIGLGVGEAAVNMLLRAMAEGDTEAKILGALTLTQIGRRDHLGVLQQALQMDEPAVRYAVAQAIQSIELRYGGSEGWF